MHLAIIRKTLETNAYGPDTLVPIGQFKILGIVGEHSIGFTHHARKTIDITVHLTHATIQLYQIHVVQFAWKERDLRSYYVWYI